MVGGTWPAGQRSGPAEPDAAQLRPWDIRDGGRSLSVLRPDSLCQCSALAWLLSLPHSGLQMGASWLSAGWHHGPLPCALGRRQTSMPTGSGLPPGPTLRAPRARWDLGQWDGWTIPTGGSCLYAGGGAGWCSAEHGWPLPCSLCL